MLLSWRNFMRVGLAKAGLLGKGQDVNMRELFDYFQNSKLQVTKGWIARDVGKILMSIDDEHLSDAESWIEKAINIDSRKGMLWSLGRNHVLYAELFKRMGREAKARENLNKAIEIFEACSADGWVKKTEEMLNSL
jgi:hypothetical protein